MTRRAAYFLAAAVFLGTLFAAGLGARAADNAGAVPISAAAPQTEDLIIEIRLGKYQVADSFVAQFGDGVTYVPVAQFAEALEIGTELHLDRKQVSGKIGAKQIVWSVDAAKGVLRHGSDTETIPAAGVFVTNDDIYLDSRLFEKIWPVTISVRLNLLRLTIDSQEPLPVEERLAREEAHKRLRNQFIYPDFPLRPSDYRLWSVPQVDFQLSSQVDRSQPSQQYYSGLATGDLLGMTGRLFVTGANLTTVPDVRFNLSRSDGAGGVFGLPALKQFSVGDITTPAFQNITNGRLERGILASSFPLDLPSGSDRTVIEGDALPGWEAELYRNAALLDYQVVPAQGQYRFVNVPLLYGTNIIRVVLYGPQGQKREEVKRLYVGPGAAAAGQGYWRFSLSDANQTLINSQQTNNNALFGSTVEPRSGVVGSAEYLYGIDPDWSIGGSVIRAPPNNATTPVPSDARNYGLAILRTNQFGIFFTEQATTSDSDGTAFDSVAQTTIGDYGLTGEYLVLSKFQSEAIDFGPDALVERARIHLDGDFGPLPFMADPVNFAVEGVRDRFQSGRVDTSILHSLFLRFGRTYFSNSVNFAQNQITGVTSANTLQGLATGNILLGKVTMRGQLQYDPRNSFQMQSFNGTTEYRWSPDTMFRATVDQTLIGRSITGVGLSASHDFGAFLLGAGGRIGTDGSLTFGLTLSVSFSGTPNGHFITSSKPVADRGSLAARVFLDRNLNGVYDDGDQLLPKATLDIDHRHDYLEENVDGDIVRTGIDPYRRTNVSVNEATLGDPYMKPVTGASFVPRPGRMEQIDLPVVETAEAEGALQLGDEGEPRPLAGIKIQLLDAAGKLVQEATSAYDGYFYFSKLVPGHYVLAIDQSTGRAANYDYVLPQAFDIAPGAIKTGLGITARRKPAR
jgi:hypothetical protein